MTDAALTHIRKKDKTMARLIERVGPFKIDRKPTDPYPALVRSIVHQQLSTKAAASIHRRLLGLFPGEVLPPPAQLASTDVATLRSAGLSRSKVAALHDLAAKVEAGLIPDARRIRRMSDDDIVEILTTIRGIGRWSVEMYLIFNLQRPDVLPANDFGVRKGFAKVYRLSELPTPAEILAFGERWRPYRTLPSWYLWRALELED